MTNRQHSRSRVALIGGVLAASVLAACGGDDDAESIPTDPAAEPSGDGELVDNEARDVLTDSLGSDDGEDLESAIASLSPETRYGVVAGQLDPEPDVEIVGSDIRLVFAGGSLADSTMACIIGSVVQEESETLTVVYPDGEKVC